MLKYQWFVFVAMAFLSWGAYVPTIHHGQLAFGVTNPNKSMRAFLFIGLAYFVMAVVVPGIWLLLNEHPADKGFTWNGAWLSTLAGILGALGALGVVFALQAGGKPLYVAPLVFSGAPIVNVLVSMVWDPPGRAPHPLFYVGLGLAVAGAALVLLYKPMPAKAGAGAGAAQVQQPAAAPTTAPATPGA